MDNYLTRSVNVIDKAHLQNLAMSPLCQIQKRVLPHGSDKTVKFLEKFHAIIESKEEI